MRFGCPVHTKTGHSNLSPTYPRTFSPDPSATENAGNSSVGTTTVPMPLVPELDLRHMSLTISKTTTAAKQSRVPESKILETSH